MINKNQDLSIAREGFTGKHAPLTDCYTIERDLC